MNLKLKKELKNAVSKYNKRQYNKKYYQKTQEKQKQTSKLYRENNKEQTLETVREWRKANPNHIIRYRKINKEKIAIKRKEYNNSPNGYKVTIKYNNSSNGYKSKKKSKWKSRGLVMDNFEEIFDRYMKTTNCDRCNIELTTGDTPAKMTTRCMDHHHKTGLFRNILCFNCNWHIVK